MCDLVQALRRRLAAVRACLAAALVAMSGCGFLDLRGDSFHENDLSDYCGQYRKTDTGTGAAAVSNKSMQIEQNLGVR